MPRPYRRTLTALVALAAATVLLAPASAPATGTTAASPQRHSSWTAPARATITPGVMMYTDGAQCTANFVYTDDRGGVYVGYAAHCAGLGAATDTNGCTTESVPIGTRVDFVRGGSLVSGGTLLGRGRLAYSSWVTERELGTTDPATCAYNDLALVKVDARDVRKVNPSVPFWGGPTGVARSSRVAAGARLYSYGNSSLRGGVSVLSPKTGYAFGDDAGRPRLVAPALHRDARASPATRAPAS